MFACRELASVAGVLLAAGAGTRYGMPKVLAEQGEWLTTGGRGAASTAAATTSWWCWAPRWSTCRRPRVRCVAEDWATGMSASLRAGLAAAGDADVAVLHLVDTPDVGADVVARVLAAASGRRGWPGRPTTAGPVIRW